MMGEDYGLNTVVPAIYSPTPDAKNGIIGRNGQTWGKKTGSAKHNTTGLDSAIYCLMNLKSGYCKDNYFIARTGDGRLIEDPTDFNFPQWPNLIAYWPFEETGGTLFDVTVNNNDGTPQGTLAYRQTGQVGYCLSFPGASTDYIDCGDIGATEGISKFSISAWFNSTASSDYRTLVSKGYHADGSWELRMTRDSEGPDVFFGVTTNNGRVQAVATVPNGSWEHVIGVYDGSKVYIYHNGSLVDSNNQTGNITDIATTVQIGRHPYKTPLPSNYEPFYGLLDEIALWAGALTAAQVLTYYNWTK